MRVKAVCLPEEASMIGHGLKWLDFEARPYWFFEIGNRLGSSWVYQEACFFLWPGVRLKH